MGTNPLKSRFSGSDNGPRLAPAQARFEAVLRGNAYLAEIGRHDVHWYIHEEQLRIGFKPERRA